MLKSFEKFHLVWVLWTMQVFENPPSKIWVCGDIFDAQLKVIVYFTRKRYMQQAAKYFQACRIQKCHSKHI